MIRDKDIIKKKKSQLKTQKEIKVYQRFENPITTLGGLLDLDVKSIPLTDQEMEILRKQGRVTRCPYRAPQN
jgi:hypothetical protein